MEILIKKLIAELKQVNERLDDIEYKLDRLENAEVYDPILSEIESNNDHSDSLLEEAIKLVIKTGTASASFLQRRLKTGYARAARLLDLMEEKGIVGPSNGAKPRDILVDEYTEKDI